MTTKKNLVKQVLMSILTAGIFSFAFTACSDDLQMEDIQQMAEMEDSGLTRSTQEGFNVNDFRVSYGIDSETDPFTYDNWRKHKGIFIHDGGNEPITVNGKTITGFSNIALPNSPNASAAANIPSDIYSEVWAEGSDWDLAFNLCGISDLDNSNFLGFYNKFTGILRIFTYIPKSAQTTGSNHMWVMQMHDILSSHAVFKYGVPMDRSIKNRDAINQPKDMAQAVSPWEAYNDGIQGQALKTGWWAFDLDLSVYRTPGEQMRISDFFNSNQTLLSLTPKCEIQNFVNLTSELKGTAAGSMKLEKVSANTENGVFAGIEGFLDKANSVKNLYDLGTKMMNPNPLEALAAGLDLAKNGCDLLGIDYGKKTTDYDGYKGEINLDLNATITTQGTITGGTSVTGVNSPALKADVFQVNSDNCQTLGEGVWNIKKTPKMYVVNDLRVDWRRQDNDYSTYNANQLVYPWIYSPFDGAANIYPNQNSYAAAEKPFRGLVCLFDPSSIEVELNPNIFPEETTTYQVTAVCGVRKGMKFGSTENYRQAQGLKGSKYEIGCNRINSHISDRPLTEAAFDGLYGFGSNNIPSGYKTGTKFEEETYNGRKCGVFGRGNSDFLIEPMALIGGKDKDDWMYYMLPAYEVTVTVTVNSNGRTFIYSRTYLPEFELCKAEDLKNVYDNAKKADKTHYTALFDSQVERIQSVRAWIARTPICTSSIMLLWDDSPKTGWTKEEECGYALIDGDPSTFWWSSKNTRTLRYGDGSDINPSVVGSHTVSWLEFHTFFCNTPKSFTLTCGKKTRNIPKYFQLIAKKDKNDKWESIYYGQINDKLSPKEGATLTLDIQNPGTYKYYRIECSGNPIDYSLAEFKFNY